MAPISSPPPPPPFFSLFLLRLSSSSHPLLILHLLYPECYHLLVSLHQGIISYFQYFNRFFFSWSDRGKNLEEGYFFSPLFFSGLLLQAKNPFQSWEAKLYRLKQTGREMEWRKWGKKRGKEKVKWQRKKRERREWGLVAAAMCLNDAFQEEQSSLSNRRLWNKLAYLLGSATRCCSAVFHIPR